MKTLVTDVGGRNCHIIQSADSPQAVIIKPLGEFERLLLMDECRMISELSDVPFTMVAFEVTEEDMRPKGAEATFCYLETELLPFVHSSFLISHSSFHIIIGGYSLGGLFALWSATKLEGIDAVYAGSPSLWMDGWDEYAVSHPTKAKYIYIGLGDMEECTKKKPYNIIGERVRQQHLLNIQQLGEENCTLQWCSGGHFADIEQRKAKGFAWCLNKLNTEEHL